MNSASEYKISAGQIARTLSYEDSGGTLCFTFDVDSENGANIVILERHSKSLIDAEQSRIDLAFERVKEYLVSRGYKVQIFG